MSNEKNSSYIKEMQPEEIENVQEVETGLEGGLTRPKKKPSKARKNGVPRASRIMVGAVEGYRNSGIPFGSDLASRTKAMILQSLIDKRTSASSTGGRYGLYPSRAKKAVTVKTVAATRRNTEKLALYAQARSDVKRQFQYTGGLSSNPASGKKYEYYLAVKNRFEELKSR